MTCFIAKNLLSDYLDEVLDPARVPELQAHLAGCPGCSHELAELRRIRQALRALPLERAPAGFAARVIARAEQPTVLERTGRFLSAAWKIPATAKAGLAFAASLVLVTTVWLNNPDRHRSAWELGGAPTLRAPLSQSAPAFANKPAVVAAATPAGTAAAVAANEDARSSTAGADLTTGRSDGRGGGDRWEAGRKGEASYKAPRQDVDSPLAGALGGGAASGGYLAEKSRGPELESANHLRRADGGASPAISGQGAAGEILLPARVSPGPEKEGKKSETKPQARVATLAKDKSEREETAGLPLLDGEPAESTIAAPGGAPAAIAAPAAAGGAQAAVAAPAAAGGKRDGLLSTVPPVANARGTAGAAAERPRGDGHAATSASRAQPAAAPPPSDAVVSSADVAGADQGKEGKGAQPASKAADTRTSVTTEQAEDVQDAAPTPKPAPGSKENPLQVKFTSDSPTGPQDVVDAAIAAGGINNAGKPARLANAGASTRVLVNLPAGAWAGFADKIGATGTLDLEGIEAPSGKVWVRIEVVKR